MEKEIVYQNRKVRFRTYGKGEPVILLHGFGEDSAIWDKQVVHLKQNYFLLVPDIPGSGNSSLLEDVSMENLADCLMAILSSEHLKEFQDKKWKLIGHSMGGYITLAFAQKYPERLSAFGLFHSSALPDDEEKKETRKKGIGFIQKNGSKSFLQTAVTNLFAPDNQQMAKEFLTSLPDFSPDALVAYYEAMMARPDRTIVYKKAGLPVLFILGRYDKAIPLESALPQTYMPDKSYIHILENSGHMGMLEESERSNRILDEFLQQT